MKVCICFRSLKQILGHDSSWKRKIRQKKKLKQALSENNEVSREIEFYLLFPEKESHRNHLTGQVDIK